MSVQDTLQELANQLEAALIAIEFAECAADTLAEAHESLNLAALVAKVNDALADCQPERLREFADEAQERVDEMDED